MICSVGIDLHQGQHRARCLDDRAQPCDSFSFQTTPEGLATLEERVFRDGANPVIVLEPAGLPCLMVAVYLRSRYLDCRLVKARTQKVATLQRYLRGPVKSNRLDVLTLAKMAFIDPEHRFIVDVTLVTHFFGGGEAVLYNAVATVGKVIVFLAMPISSVLLTQGDRESHPRP